MRGNIRYTETHPRNSEIDSKLTQLSTGRCGRKSLKCQTKCCIMDRTIMVEKYSKSTGKIWDQSQWTCWTIKSMYNQRFMHNEWYHQSLWKQWMKKNYESVNRMRTFQKIMTRSNYGPKLYKSVVQNKDQDGDISRSAAVYWWPEQGRPTVSDIINQLVSWWDHKHD